MTRPTLALTHDDLPTPRTLTPRQQLEAVRRAQSRVEQRVKLGVQLFRSAEAHLTEQHDLLAQAKQEQANLREQLEIDVARSLRAYGQRTQHMDDRLTDAIDKLEERLDVLQNRWQETEQRLEQMVRRSETLLHQSRSMLETGQARRPSVRT
ncbi:hypothetical protein ACERK3_02035 [Phycisphaerales bacterium AB-hyl4]|uniref:Uncharacterized protein n=1 Tax=Natronomicrosphaera hydrolytica TaxID=3242702 RepID=A0ABV4U0D5_9BACT